MSYLDKNGLQRYHNGIKTNLDNKADIDGTYEELTAGYANNLKYTGYREDNTPYILRQSGGNVDAGYKSEKTIVGASVVWNQLVHNGDFGRTTWWGVEGGEISVSDNVLTYTCTTTGSMLQNGIFLDIDAEINHVYFISADIKSEKANSGQWYFIGSSATVPIANTWTTISELKKATVTDTYFGIGLRTETSVGETFQARDAFIIDITKMFGTEIANYVYGLETTTSGSGVAWLKQYFPNQFDSGYQSYSDGEIKSVSDLTAHKTVGFNQWDEEWEVGVYNNSGESVTNSFQIRSKNYIPVFSSTTYYLAASAGNRICFYDANKTFISVVFDKQNTTFVTPVNCKYIRFNMADAYGTTYNHDICINISKPTGSPKNGDYVPYDGRSYPLDSTQTLRGIYKVDSNGKLYADGDTYEADGTIQRRFGVVDLGTLTWTKNGNDGKFEILEQNCPSYKLPLNNTTKGNILCGKYVTDTNENTYARVNDKTISVASTPYIRVYDSAYASSTGSDFKTAMSGVYLIYELATPTTETAEPYSYSQRVNPDGTEEFIFDSTTEVQLPVGHITKYMDQAALLDEIIIPPDEAGTYVLRKAVSDGITTYTWEDDVIPSISVSKDDGVSTITVTDETGTNSIEIADGETPHLVILSYGTSTWAQFIEAYNSNSIVYCRASSNSNPATGSKTRMAFMAYVNNETNPTNVEFQYYRSVNSHSATQQGDQVYVYKLDKTAGWTVTVRESYTRVVAGTKMSSTWSNGILTMNFDGHDLPSGGTTGQVLKKTSGTDYAVGWSDEYTATPDENTIDIYYDDSNSRYVINNFNHSGFNLSNYFLADDMRGFAVRIINVNDGQGYYMNGGEIFYLADTEYDANYAYDYYDDPSQPDEGGYIFTFKNMSKTKTLTMKVGRQYSEFYEYAEHPDITVTNESGGVMWVNFSSNGASPTYSADKTFAEINAAIDTGQTVLAADGSPYVYSLYYYDSSRITFLRTNDEYSDSTTSYWFSIYTNNNVRRETRTGYFYTGDKTLYLAVDSGSSFIKYFTYNDISDFYYEFSESGDGFICRPMAVLNEIIEHEIDGETYCDLVRYYLASFTTTDYTSNAVSTLVFNSPGSNATMTVEAPWYDYWGGNTFVTKTT